MDSNKSNGNSNFIDFMSDKLNYNNSSGYNYKKVIFTDGQIKRLQNTISDAITTRKIYTHMQNIDQNKTIGAYLFTLREKCSINQINMAEFLTLDKTLYAELEGGVTNLVTISVEAAVKVMSKLQIKFNTIKKMLEMELVSGTANTSDISAIARSNKSSQTDINIKHGVDAVLFHLSKQNKLPNDKQLVLNNKLDEIKIFLVKNKCTHLLE